MAKVLSDIENLHIVESLAEPVGELWQKLQSQYLQTYGSFNVASPLSNTPKPIYQWITAHANEFQWDNTSFVLMDEQVEGNQKPYHYVDVSDPASYEGFAKTHLLDALPHSIPILKPDLSSLEKFKPPIHLLILAIGIMGNYANVMPGTPIETGWHITKLIDEFRQAHTQQGAYTGATFRTHGMSLGPQQVLKADNVIVVASGRAKRELIQQLFSYDDFSASFPISIVRHPMLHKRVKFYLTPDTLK